MPKTPARPNEIRLDRAETVRLRARGHALKPVVRLGQAGLSDAVTDELARALDDHELVKVKLAAEGKAACDAQADALAKACGAALVQRIGHVALLYRPSPEHPKGGRAAAPAGGRGPASGRRPAGPERGGKGGGGPAVTRRTGRRGGR